MSVALDHVTRIVDGLPTIRDVSPTLENGTLAVLLLGAVTAVLTGCPLSRGT